LFVGAIVFLIIVGTRRVQFFGPEFARAGRYAHFVAGLSLPAVALAADAVVRRWRVLLPVVLLILLLGIPGNVEYLVERKEREPYLLGDPTLMLALSRAPIADEVPRNVVPMPETAPQVTIGWLLDGVASGRIPDAGPIEPVKAREATFRLSLYQSDDRRAPSSCSQLSKAVDRSLVKGQSLGIEGGQVRVVELTPEGDERHMVVYSPSRGRTLTAVAGPLTMRLVAAAPFFPVTLCG
jgi:hypothetical protein